MFKYRLAGNTKPTGGLYNTTDGGATWKKMQPPSQVGRPRCFVHFFDANTGVTVGDPVFGWKATSKSIPTSNGGANWSRVPRDNIPPPLGSWNHTEWEFFGTANSLWFRTVDIRRG